MSFQLHYARTTAPTTTEHLVMSKILVVRALAACYMYCYLDTQLR